MKKTFKLLIVAALVMSLLAGCAKSESPSSGVPASGGDDVIKATLIVRTQLGDKSFNDSAWAGVQRAGQELGIEVKVIEIGGDQTKYEPTFLDVSESDADIILVNSGAMSEVADGLADQFPDKKYVFFDMDPIFENTHDNVIALSYNQNESSYLAGVLGALMSESGEIGFIGGTENLIINDFMVGYISGAKDTNEDIKIHTSMIGNFNDTGKSKELAFVQINNGADVIHPVAGGASLGALDAVKERQIWALGVDSDQAMMLKESNPETADRIPTSALKNVNVSLYNVLKDYAEGNVEWGTTNRMGVKDGVAGIAKNEYYDKLVSEDIKAKIEEVEAKIISGEIVVPSAFDLSQDEINDLKNSVKP